MSDSQPLTGPQRLAAIRDQLNEGNSVQSETVRQFLSWFGAQRRSFWNVVGIRAALDRAKLQTEPDFESAYIDSFITFTLAPEVQDKETVSPQPAEPMVAVTPSITDTVIPSQPAAYADPTYRISKLAAANREPTSISPDASLYQAVTLMLCHDFSQLPVMTGEREVKGVISWTSIGARLSLGKNGHIVRELMDAPPEIRADASLFQAIPVIIQHQYVLVRGADNRITGIVTASDFTQQFQQLAEPFLLLDEIENHVRRIIGDQFSIEELASARDPGDNDREVKDVADLTFGEYIRLLESPERWAKLNLHVDRATFCKQLDHIRNIRNDVMHFDPDGIPPDDLDRLRDFDRFLQRLQAMGVP